MTILDYSLIWIAKHCEKNLRPSTISSYRSIFEKQIIPYIGDIELNDLTGGTLDSMLTDLSLSGLSPGSIEATRRVLSSALEHARKHGFLANNPARDISVKHEKIEYRQKQYSITHMKALLNLVEDTPWEMIIVLAGLFGLRLGEVLGLRWSNVDMKKREINVTEQLPFKVADKIIEPEKMAPVKSNSRTLPITDMTLRYFRKQALLQKRHKRSTEAKGNTYYDNGLVVAREDGSPESKTRISMAFQRLIKDNKLPLIRFHDLRHTVGYHIHELTGDALTIGQIFGHSIAGINHRFPADEMISPVTARYIAPSLGRKRTVLDAYHNEILGV